LDSAAVLKGITPECQIDFLCILTIRPVICLNPRAIERFCKVSGALWCLTKHISFFQSPSWTGRLAQFKNLIVLQTLSKAWGLAGLRLGMCFAHPEIIALA